MKGKENKRPVSSANCSQAKGVKDRENLQFNINATTTLCQSAAAQRQRIHAWLMYASLTTFEGREQLHIPHVAGRVQELRKLGIKIKTEWTTEYSAGGSRHRIARYSLEVQGGEK